MAARPCSRYVFQQTVNAVSGHAWRVIGRRTFTDADQQRFAAASGDVNPIHVDAVAARRLLSGGQLVHGMHILIEAFNLWRPLQHGNASAWAIQCNFAHPLNVGDTAEFRVTENVPGRYRLSAVVDGVAVTDVLIRRAGDDAGDAESGGSFRGPVRRIACLTAPLNDPPKSFVGQRIEFGVWGEELTPMYPHAAAWLGGAGLADLARLSFLVGMVCPGLHSVFSSLKAIVPPTSRSASGPLRVEVRSYDERFRLFVMAFSGALHGEVRTFLRPPPQAQPSAADLVGRVEANSWSGLRACVVGGSRGLGEITAKLLAASGCDVTITYASGRADAEAVANDINGLGRGRCDYIAIDLARRFAPPAALNQTPLDAVFFFATPRIYTKRAGVFSRGAFDTFVSFYLERFHEVCEWLERAGHPTRVYVPSTVFINERPKNMTEYTMAKAAAELLADEVNRASRHVRVLHTRLPRLATDQTTSVQEIRVEDNLEAMLEVLKVMRAPGVRGLCRDPRLPVAGSQASTSCP